MKNLLFAGAALCALASGAQAASGDGVGALTGGGPPDSFGTWIPNTVTVGGDYLNYSGWSQFEHLQMSYTSAGDGTDSLALWAAWENALPGRRMVTVGIPLYAWGVSGTFQACAAGSYDSHFTALANNILASGIQHIDLRAAWEFDGSWQGTDGIYPSGDYASFVGCWQHMASAIHAVDTKRVITFDWNPTPGCCGFMDGSDDPTAPTSVENKYWPGDGYVDYVGGDLYANSSYPVASTQAALLAFAKSHNKPITFPEWGVWNADDPNYIQTMFNFISNASNNVAFAPYFNAPASDGNHILTGNTSFPQSAAKYKSLFASPYGGPVSMFVSAQPPPPSGSDTLKLFLSEDPNSSQNAQAQLLVDNVAFGSPVTVTSVFGSGSGQEFDISLASVAAGNHTFAVRFLNDVNNAGGDLNLHVNSFTLNGVSYQPGAGSVTCWSTSFTALYCTGDQAAYPNVPVVHSVAPAETLAVNKPPYHGVVQTVTGSIANLSSAPASLDLVVNGVASPATCPTLTAAGFSCAWTPAAAGSYTIQVKDHATGAASPAVNVTIN